MPARQRGWVRKRKSGWQACWRVGGRQRTGPDLFPTKTQAKDWLTEHLAVEATAPRTTDLTFAEHVERYLRMHATSVDQSTIRTLRERLGATPKSGYRQRPYRTAIEAFGHVTLRELEALSLEIAEWQATLPPRYRYAIVRSLRQVLNAATRWKLIGENPANRAGPNPQPRNPEVPSFDSLASVDRLAIELAPCFAPIVVFGVETGLRPSEWIALERRHVDRNARVVKVRQAIVDGKLKEYGKTARSRRALPLTTRALAAIDSLPTPLDSKFLFSTTTGKHIGLDNWRRREWKPALVSAGLDIRLTPYAMRHTYASFALDAGISIFELSRLMGTSVKVIDDTYGHLVHDSLDRVRAALEERAMRESRRQ
jgi:integrase